MTTKIFFALRSNPNGVYLTDWEMPRWSDDIEHAAQFDTVDKAVTRAVTIGYSHHLRVVKRTETTEDLGVVDYVKTRMTA